MGTLGRTDWHGLVATARSLPLDRVATALGCRRDVTDKARWKRPGSVLSINGEKFFDHLAGTGGGGAISLVMHAHGSGRHAIPKRSAIRKVQRRTWFRGGLHRPALSVPPSVAPSSGHNCNLCGFRRSRVQSGNKAWTYPDSRSRRGNSVHVDTAWTCRQAASARKEAVGLCRRDSMRLKLKVSAAFRLQVAYATREITPVPQQNLRCQRGRLRPRRVAVNCAFAWHTHRTLRVENSPGIAVA